MKVELYAYRGNGEHEELEPVELPFIPQRDSIYLCKPLNSVFIVREVLFNNTGAKLIIVPGNDRREYLKKFA